MSLRLNQISVVREPSPLPEPSTCSGECADCTSKTSGKIADLLGDEIPLTPTPRVPQSNTERD